MSIYCFHFLHSFSFVVFQLFPSVSFSFFFPFIFTFTFSKFVFFYFFFSIFIPSFVPSFLATLIQIYFRYSFSNFFDIFYFFNFLHPFSIFFSFMLFSPSFCSPQFQISFLDHPLLIRAPPIITCRPLISFKPSGNRFFSPHPLKIVHSFRQNDISRWITSLILIIPFLCPSLQLISCGAFLQGKSRGYFLHQRPLVSKLKNVTDRHFKCQGRVNDIGKWTRK